MVIRTLEDGLTIISQCKSKTDHWAEAHFGAASIASYFFIKENPLSKETANRIITESEAMVDKHLSTRPANIIATVDSRDAENMILESLDLTIDQLHYVGHNVIYAALSLLALQDLKGRRTKDEIEGISTLLHSFDNTIPGRSWLGYADSEVKKLEIDENDRIPAIENAEDLSEFILNELSSFSIIYRAESHHDLIGHMLTFSHALNILYDLGYVKYFKRGLSPLLQLVKVLRASQNLDPDEPIQLCSPVDRLPLIRAERSEWLPVDHEYWAKDFTHHNWDFGHVFKFSFSFYNHLNRVLMHKSSVIEKFRYIIYIQ